jgi:hypothetical protein
MLGSVGGVFLSHFHNERQTMNNDLAESLRVAMSALVADPRARQECRSIFENERIASSAPILSQWMRRATDADPTPQIKLANWRDVDVGEGLLMTVGLACESWESPLVNAVLPVLQQTLATAAAVRLTCSR